MGFTHLPLNTHIYNTIQFLEHKKTHKKNPISYDIINVTTYISRIKVKYRPNRAKIDKLKEDLLSPIFNCDSMNGSGDDIGLM